MRASQQTPALPGLLVILRIVIAPSSRIIRRPHAAAQALGRREPLTRMRMRASSLRTATPEHSSVRAKRLLRSRFFYTGRGIAAL